MAFESWASGCRARSVLSITGQLASLIPIYPVNALSFPPVMVKNKIEAPSNFQNALGVGPILL